MFSLLSTINIFSTISRNSHDLPFLFLCFIQSLCLPRYKDRRPESVPQLVHQAKAYTMSVIEMAAWYLEYSMVLTLTRKYILPKRKSKESTVAIFFYLNMIKKLTKCHQTVMYVFQMLKKRYEQKLLGEKNCTCKVWLELQCGIEIWMLQVQTLIFLYWLNLTSPNNYFLYPTELISCDKYVKNKCGVY